MPTDIDSIAARVLELSRRIRSNRSALVAITGIDGSGKGYVSAQLAGALTAARLRVARIAADGWLNLPRVRFTRTDPALHFYRHAMRFEEMFARLVLPLRDHRSLTLRANLLVETARRYREHTYRFDNVDVILLEGIYLLKRELQSLYDLSAWVACSFRTALERAVARSQEGLPPAETIRAYETIYFPAQRIHFLRDAPKRAAAMVITNDHRLAARSFPAAAAPGGA